MCHKLFQFTKLAKCPEGLGQNTRLDEGERAELARLRREIHQLKMEKEILKKASAFFAKEMK